MTDSTPDPILEPSTIDPRYLIDLRTRGHQVYPVLGEDDLKRIRRFATERSWHDGDFVFRALVDSPGMVVVLSGQLRCSRSNALGHRVEVHLFEAGQFTGEVSQLSGRPPLVDGVAVGRLEALVLDPEALRALLMA